MFELVRGNIDMFLILMLKAVYGDHVTVCFELLMMLYYFRKLRASDEVKDLIIEYRVMMKSDKRIIRKCMLDVMKLSYRKYIRWKTDLIQRIIQWRKINMTVKRSTSFSKIDRNGNSSFAEMKKWINNNHPRVLLGMMGENKVTSHQRVNFDTDSFEIGIDNRTSYSMSGYVKDFASPIQPIKNYWIRGISGAHVRVNGVGTIKWKIDDDENKTHEILIPNSLYIKSFKGRLLSPQHWGQVADDNHPMKDGTVCVTGAQEVKLMWDQRKYVKTVPVDHKNNCFTFRSSIGMSRYCEFDKQFRKEKIAINEECVLCMDATVNDSVIEEEVNEIFAVEQPEIKGVYTQKDSEDNEVSVSDVEKLYDEQKTSISASSPEAELMRWHYRLGHVSFQKLRAMALLGIIPKHLAKVKPPVCAGCLYGAMTKKPWRTKPSIKKEARQVFKAKAPGECISVDQMQSTEGGFIAQIKGKLTRRRYHYATVFVDHFSGLCYIHLQRTITSVETLQAKHAFEAFSDKNNVRIKHYHADNGRFADNMFVVDVEKQGQTISYCGVGAHFQNGRAEKMIRDLRESARKMILHAKSRWPQAVSIHLWPYALRTAMDCYNEIPTNTDGISRLERFNGVNVSTKLTFFHTWGCPIFALKGQLQSSSGKLSKWDSRARLGLNLGRSPRHARSVSLVLNLQTGLVSPQFHIRHDDFFETVGAASGNTTHSTWQVLAGFIRMGRRKLADTEVVVKQPDRVVPMGESENVQQNNDPPKILDKDHAQIPSEGDQGGSYINKDGVRRSHRLMNNSPVSLMSHVVDNDDGQADIYEALHEDDLRIQKKLEDPISFKASADPDTMYWHQAMAQPDANKFLDAAKKEFDAHCDNKHWDIIERKDVPRDKNVLPAVWAMKRKRDILTRKVKKYKARLNVHGGKQVFGEDFYETFSPVVMWMTVRFLLILSLICGWHTKQVDFVLAYPQADIEQEMFMELPVGIHPVDDRKDYVLKLRKNLYGQKQAGRVWAQHLKKGLLHIGFQQSKVDECLFYRGKTLFVVYVDDGIFFSSNKNEIDEAIEELKAERYNIDDMGTITDYLGVHFKYEENKIILTQPQLIQQIIDDTKIMAKKFKPPNIPAKSTVILNRNKDGTDFDRRWHYRSVIGKLNFLEKCTRPDLAYAVHQCARFCEEPKQNHAIAVEYIAKYLSGTKDKGIIIMPRGDPIIDVYADADFSGEWNKLNAPFDPSTAKSRSGYIINFAKCPIVWSSKIQTQIALSTTEAEYIALSQSLREGIPLMELVKELRNKKIISVSEKAHIYCRCFEDNSGALELARTPKLRPRTKHINIIYHHFRSFVAKGLVKIYPIESEEQLADILTKPLPQNQFQYLRKKFMMW